jgi:hypothetical protein
MMHILLFIAAVASVGSTIFAVLLLRQMRETRRRIDEARREINRGRF